MGKNKEFIGFWGCLKDELKDEKPRSLLDGFFQLFLAVGGLIAILMSFMFIINMLGIFSPRDSRVDTYLVKKGFDKSMKDAGIIRLSRGHGGMPSLTVDQSLYIKTSDGRKFEILREKYISDDAPQYIIKFSGDGSIVYSGSEISRDDLALIKSDISRAIAVVNKAGPT